MDIENDVMTLDIIHCICIGTISRYQLLIMPT